MCKFSRDKLFYVTEKVGMNMFNISCLITLLHAVLLPNVPKIHYKILKCKFHVITHVKRIIVGNGEGRQN